MVDRGSLVEIDGVAVAVPANDHMMAAGGDEGETRGQTVTCLGFAHFQIAELVEAIGKGAREIGGDVLDDEDGWEVGGKVGEDGLERLGSTGGSAHEDELAGGIASLVGADGGFDARRGEQRGGGGAGGGSRGGGG